ncbi:hypothetical protein EJ08DRAFT_655144 [Tothia fuscella]|uniref:Uncharacterized protein n=1 Tax=Tothia fuscella TaxID=1048955 RepID=A0A9P4P440_9PEZI|nr:hypothetical protein EJ08DRAFT_655144 [Tothia fuscella]
MINTIQFRLRLLTVSRNTTQTLDLGTKSLRISSTDSADAICLRVQQLLPIEVRSDARLRFHNALGRNLVPRLSSFLEEDIGTPRGFVDVQVRSDSHNERVCLGYKRAVDVMVEREPKRVRLSYEGKMVMKTESEVDMIAVEKSSPLLAPVISEESDTMDID